MHTQLLVIGGGPGGYAAAFSAADAGLQVALVESNPALGGTCLLEGCVPSKALLHATHVATEVRHLQADGWGLQCDALGFDVDQLRRRKDQLVKTLSGGLAQLAKRRKVTVVQGRASFVDSTTVALHDVPTATDQDAVIRFDHAVIATGARPIIPPALQIDSPRVWTSRQALALPSVPESLLVVGGGYIGLELATVYSALGSNVTVVELTDSLLPGVDSDLVRPVARRMNQQLQNHVHLNTQVAALRDMGTAVEARLDGPDGSRTEQFTAVLIAVGRRPVTDTLGLEHTDVVIDSHGFIECNGKLQTADPHILAIGDVTGQPMLAHRATHQAKIAAEVVTGQSVAFDKLAIPAVVFTNPEVAWVGLTERTAREGALQYATAIYPWAASGRAHAMGRPEGLTKWLYDPTDGTLLGCGIVGSGAGELIGEATLALEMGGTVRDLGDTIHPHPTLSETLMNAADVALGTAIEIYKPKR